MTDKKDTLSVHIRDYVDVEVPINQHVDIPIGDILDAMDSDQISDITRELINHEIRDLYIAVHEGSPVDVEHQFLKLFEIIDENPPHVQKRAA